jgi:1-acyl-sn-glycerol-3-phosphate acyltransferase
MVVPLYCRQIKINKPELLHAKGPLLIAANHPNSFLDGIILTTLFQNPIYTLARGDAFKKPNLRKNTAPAAPAAGVPHFRRR